MKKYLLPGLMTAIALGLPLVAQAQMAPSSVAPQSAGASPSLTTPYTTPSGSYSSPSLGLPSSQPSSSATSPYSGLSGQPSSLGTPSASQTSPGLNPSPSVSAQQTPLVPDSSQTSQQTTSQTTVSQMTQSTTQVGSVSLLSPSSGEVIVGSGDVASVIPPLTIGMGTTTINVANPGPNPVTFAVPNLNLSYVVPPNSERTIQIDRTQTANLTPGQVIAYYINDSSGNQIASSSLTNNEAIASQINTNTQFASEQKSETTAQNETVSPSQRRSTVRGYW